MFVTRETKIFGWQLTDLEGEESRVNYGGIVTVWILMVTAHKSALNPIKLQLQFYFSALDQQQYGRRTQYNATFSIYDVYCIQVCIQ